MADPAKPDPRQIDMLTSPEEAAGLAVGTIDGPPGWHEGLGAGLRVYIGEGQWRDLGDLKHLAAALILHRGRITATLAWDLGAMKLNGVRPEADADP